MMIIDIFTKEEFSAEMFENKINQQARIRLVSRKCKHCQSRYILKDRWNELVTELVDEKGNLYLSVSLDSIKYYFPHVNPNEKAYICQVINEKRFFTIVQGVKIYRKSANSASIKKYLLSIKEKNKASGKTAEYLSRESVKARRKELDTKWKKDNREHFLKRTRDYQKNKLLCDPSYRISKNLRSRIRSAIKNNQKSGRTLEILGCDILFLKVHLESKFKEGMTWENYGLHGWHIDHIRPCDSFDLSDPEQQKKCFHYSNLQPLWAKDNLSKGSRFVI